MKSEFAAEGDAKRATTRGEAEAAACVGVLQHGDFKVRVAALDCPSWTAVCRAPLSVRTLDRRRRSAVGGALATITGSHGSGMLVPLAAAPPVDSGTFTSISAHSAAS